MVKRALIALVLILTGCSQSGQNIGPYHIDPLPEEGRFKREAEKREYLRLEDLIVGTGPIAARGRRVTAEIDVRYTDGTLVYRGTIISYPGFLRLIGTPDSRVLNMPAQWGIDLGLNGMAVGGRRRMTINRKLVCEGTEEGDPFGTQCRLIGSTFKDEVIVRKQDLIVEATLNESCNPVITWRGMYIFGVYLINIPACREESAPQLIPGAPIWHYY